MFWTKGLSFVEPKCRVKFPASSGRQSPKHREIVFKVTLQLKVWFRQLVSKRNTSFFLIVKHVLMLFLLITIILEVQMSILNERQTSYPLSQLTVEQSAKLTRSYRPCHQSKVKVIYVIIFINALVFFFFIKTIFVVDMII